MLFLEEAEDCRRKALAYLGQPEGTLLLLVAREFDRLASEGTARLGAKTSPTARPNAGPAFLLPE